MPTIRNELNPRVSFFAEKHGKGTFKCPLSLRHYLGDSRHLRKKCLLHPRAGLLKEVLGKSWKTFKCFKTSSIVRAHELYLCYLDICVCLDPEILSIESNRSIGVKVFNTACFSTSTATSLYKEFVENVLILLKCKEGEERWTRQNPFKRMMTWKIFQDAIASVQLSKGKSLERVLSVLTTRNFPEPDGKSIQKKKVDFIGIISQQPPKGWKSEEYRSHFLESIEEIANECESTTVSDCHISVTAAGSLKKTVREGGKFAEMIEEVKGFLAETPSNEELYEFANLKWTCNTNEPRWKTFGIIGEINPMSAMTLFTEGVDFLNEVPNQYLGPIDFSGGSLPPGIIPEEDLFITDLRPFRMGLGAQFGNQLLLYCCVFYKKDELPMIRASPVLEGGDKVRWITMASWRDLVIQQAAATIFRSLMESHKEMKPIFSRANLAWVYLNKAREIGPSDICYVSDYSSATDTVDREFAEFILTNFIKRFRNRLSDPLLNFLELGIRNAVSPKVVIFPTGERITSSRGVFMGEPMSKVILTLIMFTIGKAAKSIYKLRFPKSMEKLTFWAPGDDLVATGPTEYIDIYSELAKILGQILNHSKVFKSRTVFKLCEQWFWVPGLKSSVGTWAITTDPGKYRESAWVDTVKLKLLGAMSLSNHSHFEERNEVIGKAKALSKILRWLPSDTYPLEYKKLLRTWFLCRFEPKLPRTDSKTFAFLMLPGHLGGFDLLLDDQEIREAYQKVSSFSRILFNNYYDDFIVGSYLRNMLRNRSYRGFALSEDYNLTVEKLVKYYTDLLEEAPYEEYKDSKVEGLSFRETDRALFKAGFLTENRIRDIVSRPLAFGSIWGRTLKHSPYNTTPISVRLAKLWKNLTGDTERWKNISLKGEISEDDFVVLCKENKGPVLKVYRRNDSLEDEVLIGLPSMKVSLGILPHDGYISW
uniref:Putative RNA dependent RNA polymerase n=1 Tax=Leptomonas Narna-like virus 1 TaxID=2041416 RepID=A0A291LQY2_9VIRU|nr:putative RNA dependent RNA polymerase [Leptomonas Narna-like virus 1]